MLRRYSPPLLISLLALFVLCPTSQSLAENLRFGSLGVHPFVTGSVGYTDNVFLTESNEESDTFYLLSPGVELTLPFQKYNLGLNYTMDWYTYRDQDDADRVIHNATGTFDLNPWRSLEIHLADEFTRGADPPDFEGARVGRYVWNNASVDAAYDITSRIAVGAGYAYGIKRYDRSVNRIDDYDQNDVAGRLYYKVLPKTSLVLTYLYTDREYDRRSSQDSQSNRLEGGVTWEIGAKTTGTARVGYMETEYDALNREDDTVSYAIDLTYQLRPKTTLGLEGVREVLDTSNADDNVAFSNSYVSTQIGGILTHRYRKLTGRLTAAYIRDDYLHDDIAAGRKRDDDLVRFEFGLEYAPRSWLTLGGSYRYTDLSSNFNTEEYTENAFLLYVSVIL